jgi:hypothetical protein
MVSPRIDCWENDQRAPSAGKMIRTQLSALAWIQAISNSVFEKCPNWSEIMKNVASTPDRTCT